MSLVKPPVSIIAAMTRRRVIGRDGELPWNLPEELGLFRRLTLGGDVIMGRRTWEALPAPLDGRRNLVLSRQLEEISGGIVCGSLEEALDLARDSGERAWIIGGAQVYRQALPLAAELHISWIHHDWPGEVIFPPLKAAGWALHEQTSYRDFTYCLYRRRDSGDRNDPTPLAPPPLPH